MSNANVSRPKPRLPDSSKSQCIETDFFEHSKYIVPWNRLRVMWIIYFGVQEEFPEGVGVKQIRNALRTCERHKNNPGINKEEIGKWKEKFLKWTNEAESLAQEIEEPGNHI